LGPRCRVGRSVMFKVAAVVLSAEERGMT